MKPTPEELKKHAEKKYGSGMVIVGDKDTWSIMDGQYRLKDMSDIDDGLPLNLPKRTNDETAQCIQSWYENRRD